jgi:hypothetical protein
MVTCGASERRTKLSPGSKIRGSSSLSLEYALSPGRSSSLSNILTLAFVERVP